MGIYGIYSHSSHNLLSVFSKNYSYPLTSLSLWIYRTIVLYCYIHSYLLKRKRSFSFHSNVKETPSFPVSVKLKLKQWIKTNRQQVLLSNSESCCRDSGYSYSINVISKFSVPSMARVEIALVEKNQTLAEARHSVKMCVREEVKQQFRKSNGGWESFLSFVAYDHCKRLSLL